jgi:signal peptidase I
MPDKKPERASPDSGLQRKLVILIAKIASILLVLYILLFRIYGFVRIDTNAMSPSISGGDLAFVFHLNSDYSVGDVVNYQKENRAYTGRVVAKAGDVIDVKDGKITINGNQEDTQYYGENAMPDHSNFSYPYKVAEKQLFILGDNRTEYDDSRTFGVINYSEVTGRIIGIFRSHGI